MAFAGISISASAQRLIPGQWDLTFGGGVSTISTWPADIEVAFNRVNYHSKMICKIAGMTEKRDYVSSKATIPIESRNYDIYASWGYLWNLCHNRSRSVNLWAGVTVDAGARVRNCLADFNQEYLPSGGFLYGFSPELNFEFFPASNFSMSVFARPHCQWVTRSKDFSEDGKEDFFYPIFGIQFNFYMFVGK